MLSKTENIKKQLVKMVELKDLVTKFNLTFCCRNDAIVPHQLRYSHMSESLLLDIV